MSTYKLWIQLERHNCDNEDCENETGDYDPSRPEYDNLGEPHDVGPFDTYAEALVAMSDMLALTGGMVDPDLENEPEE